MNILMRELKAGLKPFLFWSLGLLFFIFMGMTKATGLSGGGGFSELAAAFPKIVTAMLLMSNADIDTFGGFYSVLAQYAALLSAVYAVWLGGGAVARESIDKTYEFLFTKPRSRSGILSLKLLAALIYLTAYAVLNGLLSAASAAALRLEGGAGVPFWAFSASAWLTGLAFFSLAAFFAAFRSSAERGLKLANAAVLVSYALGVLYDMLEKGGALRFFALFKYFLPTELLEGRLEPLFAALSLCVSAAALAGAFLSFERRDLKAAQ